MDTKNMNMDPGGTDMEALKMHGRCMEDEDELGVNEQSNHEVKTFT
jgi:hypothetical protein